MSVDTQPERENPLIGLTCDCENIIGLRVLFNISREMIFVVVRKFKFVNSMFMYFSVARILGQTFYKGEEVTCNVRDFSHKY